MTSFDDTRELPVFPLGTRVRVRGAEWPDGTLGTIQAVPQLFQAMYLEGEGFTPPTVTASHVHHHTGPRETIEQFVVFDEPVDDGSGDGPYRASMIWTRYLVPAGHRRSTERIE